MEQSFCILPESSLCKSEVDPDKVQFKIKKGIKIAH